MKRACLTIAFVAVLALFVGQAAVAAEGIGLRSTAGARFPDRTYVLTLPDEMVLQAGAVKVRENGKLVEDVSVVPANQAETGEFGVVLVVDASDSMKGTAIVRAMEAARAFATYRQSSQMMAVITFNKETNVVVALTADGEVIAEGVADVPPLARGTHIYDAVEKAVAMIEAGDLSVGSVVVLSDGADTGSVTSLEDAAAKARDARVRIFSVGLQSGSFDAGPLRKLAGAAGGDYAEAQTTDDLKPILEGLGAKLASEYLLRYRSSADANQQIHVSVRVRGLDGIGTVAYSSPEGANGAGEVFRRSFADLFWSGSAGMIAVSAFTALLVAAALIALVRPRRRSLQRRMAEFVSVVPVEQGGADAQRTDVVLSAAERSFEHAKWWARFKEELEIGGITVPPVHIFAWTAVATLLGMWLLAVLSGHLFFGLFALAIPFVIRAAIKRKVARERRLFGEQLPDNLQVLASALRAGHSLVGALAVVVDDCPSPSRAEFRRIIADEQLGVPLEEAFGVVVRRMENTDLQQVALVAALQRETGGNTAEVLDRVCETIRQRFELRRMVKTLTTQGRMSRWVVSLLPVGLLALITLINPEYMAPLYSNAAGRILLLIAAVMVVSGSIVIRKIVDIKV
jgi:tight adherence protein B